MTDKLSATREAFRVVINRYGKEKAMEKFKFALGGRS